MILALLLAAASAPSVVDAEYDYARDAQRIGQWTAFRKWADHDAVMFAPKAVWARDLLARLKDPPHSVRWWPAHSFISCDGRSAVNTGPWIAADGKTHGTFTTVWQRSGAGWRWVLESDETQGGGLPAVPTPVVQHAACSGRALGPPIIPPPPLTPKQSVQTPVDNGRGQSADRTLGWDWKVDAKGGRIFRLYLWNGTRYAQVLYDNVPAP